MAWFLPRLSPLLILLVVLNAYFLLIYVLVRKGWIGKGNLSLFGPALMIKTQRGRGLLDWLARARGLFDRAAGFGTYLTYAVMALMSLLLVAQLWVLFRIPPEQAPSPRLILGIPGINPIIPIGYGIVALVFAVVVHELSHGVLARVHNLRVRTMGILLLVIPIGAFVEPDEEDLKRAPRRVRVRVFSAGPTSNLFFALLFALLFSGSLMSFAEPLPGAPIQSVETPGPACDAGLLPTWIITHMGTQPSAATAQEVRDRSDFTRVLAGLQPGQTLYVFVRDPRIPPDLEDRRCVNATNLARGVYPITPVACQEQYGAEACRDDGQTLGHPDPLNRAVIGISLYASRDVHALLANPLPGIAEFQQQGAAALRPLLFYVSLPFFALEGEFPLAGAFPDFYAVPFHAGTFWFLANTAYWLFWINLMLGLTNALPILPLDGGHMFRDLLGAGLARARPRLAPERREVLVRRVSVTVALGLLALVVLQFVGPRLAGLVR